MQIMGSPLSSPGVELAAGQLTGPNLFQAVLRVAGRVSMESIAMEEVDHVGGHEGVWAVVSFRNEVRLPVRAGGDRLGLEVGAGARARALLRSWGRVRLSRRMAVRSFQTKSTLWWEHSNA